MSNVEDEQDLLDSMKMCFHNEMDWNELNRIWMDGNDEREKMKISLKNLFGVFDLGDLFCSLSRREEPYKKNCLLACLFVRPQSQKNIDQ